MKSLKGLLLTIVMAITIFICSADDSALAQTPSAAQNNNDFSTFIQDNATETLKSLADYGNWCGVNNTSSPETPAIDGVDEVCKAHDLCIGNGDHKCSCDTRFLKDMSLASASSKTGEAYKIASIDVISVKPCYCSSRLPNYPCCDLSGCKICQGGDILWPGVGGQCGPKP